MADSPKYPPLQQLHPDASLSPVKLLLIERLSTEALKASLMPGRRDSLKTRPTALYWMGTTVFSCYGGVASMWTACRGK